MSRFIQPLEARVLLSTTPVTKTTLLADQNAIVADVAAVKSALKPFVIAVTADVKSVLANLKGASNAALVKSLKADAAKLLATVKKDVSTAGGSVLSVTKRATADGISLIAKPTSTQLQAKVASDETALNRLTSTSFAALNTDVTGSKVLSDLNGILTANSGNAALAAAVAKAKTDISADAAPIESATTKLSTDLSTLSSDLGSTSSLGTTSSGLPLVVGTFQGTMTQQTGDHAGRVSVFILATTAEEPNGTIGGRIVLTPPGETALTANFLGSVVSSGNVNATFVLSGETITLTSKLTGRTISGTYSSTGSGNGSGTFTVTFV